MKLNMKEIQFVSSLPADKRYTYFIKKVADWEECWGLYENGWTLLADNDGNTVFPLWPAAEYAQACATEDWSSCKPKSITFDELLDGLLPELKAEKTFVCAFIVPADKFNAVTVEAEKILKDLETECALYD